MRRACSVKLDRRGGDGREAPGLTRPSTVGSRAVAGGCENETPADKLGLSFGGGGG